ncbi:CLUMA_CG000047, isoform A [Clunio marinus]|uniref:CLUMA_CG000047, isoform A n=1 Tax=Clunio marinus TaxID=568069 RepID=A0A1J1HJX1_9DIPT|nr:CLUMA_CG000047, isoform A [Clunio marinus]
MPTVIRMPKDQENRHGKNRNGFNIGCFRVCTCIHLGFLTSKSGMLKLFELLLGSCCETLLINFGMRELSTTAFHSFLTTVTACLSTTFTLCFCYTLSSKSFSLIRQSLFELLFNAMACFFYSSAACYMGFMSKLPSYRNILLFTMNNTNPALTCIYYMGTVLAVVYAIDTIVAYKYYRDSGD